ncbi:DNA-binding protein Rfx5 [Frankliniella fusca]|uniref:DNA-binding protein Rfx5 n=1 Tax=Frankliniella fusca TaxID=407009 RepID=A0AAE1HW11_9NEOP|nr:DNA-binding protein Rfx5 [Frankliniella fusca]
MDAVTRGTASPRLRDPGPGRKVADELPPAFASVQQEINYYARFLQPLVTALPAESDRATAAQWSLVLTAGDARPGVHDEYLRQLLVCCALGRLLGVFATPPPSATLRPLPERHTLAWLKRTAHALEERERAPRNAGEAEAKATTTPESEQGQGQADAGSGEDKPDGGSGRDGAAPGGADAGEPADRQPVRVEVSAGGSQYLAVQEGKDDGDDCHFYLAFSPEPLTQWVGVPDIPDEQVPQVVVPEEPSGGSGRSGTQGSGSVPWLSSHEGEGLDWLIANPGFLTLPSAERPDSDLWQEASPEPHDDAFADYGPGTTVDDAALPTQSVWLEDEWGGLSEADAVLLDHGPGPGPGLGGSLGLHQQWRPAEQVIAELGVTGLGGDGLEDPWSEPVASAGTSPHFSPDYGAPNLSPVFGGGGGGPPAFQSPAADRPVRTTPGAGAGAGTGTPRSQVRLLIGTPSKEAVVVPGESSPRSLRSAVSSRPASPASASIF